ncbi:MAG: nucleotidyl transferase AbiEii/AbiGii toxin family protein [Bdellovibrionaceae bacterium]|nr:nucleotidyl transferase AbiEii/AbiGii toxin family protein [Pseudobdellovibrionaceae bacterium]MBX3033941.1 nucleotidyl transferase AbiEii/AbiGii toxin family protein [Pseudobdellovibrionaceae bacterium]
MKITKMMSRKQFAAVAVRQLEKHGISCVLVGGACVSIYTNERHASKDLDFISPYSHEQIAKALSEIGFEKQGRYFKHPSSKLYLEFPNGPIGIGNKVPVKPEHHLKVGNTIIQMLSPTQCVMDRLAAWFHWNDRRSLIHALWVCERHPINMAKIKRWAINENNPEKFAQFLDELKKLKQSKKEIPAATD